MVRWEDSDDFVAWHFDNLGRFSVKSAYKVHIDVERQSAVRQEGQGSDSISVKNEVFAKLWKAKCPPKVHHFLWRMAHNSHPLYMNIERKGVHLDTRCAVCAQ